MTNSIKIKKRNQKKKSYPFHWSRRPVEIRKDKAILAWLGLAFELVGEKIPVKKKIDPKGIKGYQRGLF